MEIGQKLTLNCQDKSEKPRALNVLLDSNCNHMPWILRSDSGDRSVADRLLLRSSSQSKTDPSAAELEMPGPVLALSSDRTIFNATAVVFNLASGAYEVYRISLACGN